MKIEEHIEFSKKALDLGVESIASNDFEVAIHCFASAYSDVRQLMDHAWRLKRQAALAASPPGENAR